MERKYNINLLEDGSVVTMDGEFLGIYHLDAEDHPWFTPYGETEPVIFNPFIPLFCEEIENWHQAQTGGYLVKSFPKADHPTRLSASADGSSSVNLLEPVSHRQTVLSTYYAAS